MWINACAFARRPLSHFAGPFLIERCWIQWCGTCLSISLHLWRACWLRHWKTARHHIALYGQFATVVYGSVQIGVVLWEQKVQNVLLVLGVMVGKDVFRVLKRVRSSVKSGESITDTLLLGAVLDESCCETVMMLRRKQRVSAG